MKIKIFTFSIFHFLQKIGERSAIARRRLFRAAVGFSEKETDRDRQRERESMLLREALPGARVPAAQAVHALEEGYGGALADFFFGRFPVEKFVFVSFYKNLPRFSAADFW